MTLQVGTYHFGRHHRNWGIWVCTYVKDGAGCSSFVKDVYSYDEAVKETYRLNGWGEPKRVYKQFN